MDFIIGIPFLIYWLDYFMRMLGLLRIEQKVELTIYEEFPDIISYSLSKQLSFSIKKIMYLLNHVIWIKNIQTDKRKFA